MTVWSLANAVVARRQAMPPSVLCVLVECVERAASSLLCSRVLFNLTAATAAAAASFEMTSHLMGFALVPRTPADHGSGATRWLLSRSPEPLPRPEALLSRLRWRLRGGSRRVKTES